jgi:predicted hotdog family 3-hydroxylacyl-ACP dehydratase
VKTDLAITDLVPHSGAMSWLDRVIEADAESLLAEATVRADHLLLRDGQLGAAAGVEYMAQAAAAWAGWQRHASATEGGAARIGFLLGTRRYQCSRAAFRVGDVLRVSVQRLFQADNGLGQFECVIRIDGAEVARASLNVFGPDDPEAFLNGQTP